MTSVLCTTFIPVLVLTLVLTTLMLGVAMAALLVAVMQLLQAIVQVLLGSITTRHCAALRNALVVWRRPTACRLGGRGLSLAQEIRKRVRLGYIEE